MDFAAIHFHGGFAGAVAFVGSHMALGEDVFTRDGWMCQDLMKSPSPAFFFSILSELSFLRCLCFKFGLHMCLTIASPGSTLPVLSEVSDGDRFY